jgi:hypothetical protein
MGRMFDENALPAMLGSPCSTQAGVPTPTSAGIAGLASTGHRGPNLSAVARSYQFTGPSDCRAKSGEPFNYRLRLFGVLYLQQISRWKATFS